MSDQRIRGDAEAVWRQLLRRPLPLSGEAFWTVHGAEKEVLSNGEFAHQRVVLIDDGQAQPARLQRIGGGKRVAHDRDAAFVGGDRAGGDAEKRALARAVLAKNGVNFPRPAYEVDAVEGLHAGIALGDA